jgi:hypothetical protein
MKTITSATSTKEEAQSWFGFNFTSCVFISEEVKSLLSFGSIAPLDSLIVNGVSKVGTTNLNALDYYNGIVIGPSDLTLIGLYPNVAPIAMRRSI